MCRVDYAESTGEVLLTPECDRKARKDHRCIDCDRVIRKGETYRYTSWVGGDGGGYSDLHLCLQCRAAGKWLFRVCGGSIYGEINEELRDHWTEDPLYQTHGLNWLITAGRQHWQRNGTLIPPEVVSAWVDRALVGVSA